jgi:cold shock CspA family protein
MKRQRYIGRIASVPGSDGYAFIGITSVTQTNGMGHGINTETDIFLHKDDCSTQLQVGKTVAFDIEDDLKRGKGNFRAIGAIEFIEVDVLPPENTPMAEFTALAPFGSRTGGSLIVPATPAQRKMKPVPQELVEKVLENQPAPCTPRDSSEPPNKNELMRLLLEHLFPTMGGFGTEFTLDGEESEFSRIVEQTIADQENLGMKEQVATMKDEVKRFLEFRKALHFMVQNSLVRRDTIIPIEYLPEFFTAVPVWYFWKSSNDTATADSNLTVDDPETTDTTRYFCDLFPNQQWSDFFQMYNRRLRTLKHYKGDIIPPNVTKRIKEAIELFDHVVIMTPYHDVAGHDWKNLNWIRSIDPYVVGFKKGIPYFFILGRFSDSGTFPLFNELIADTMDFLKKNKASLRNFDITTNPYWYLKHKTDPNLGVSGGAENSFFEGYKDGNRVLKLGGYLQKVADQILLQFEQGNLFNWLRGSSGSNI